MSYDNQFVTTIDVPIEQEILYDYDDMYGVVDDKINPPENESHTPTLSIIEILGGKCTICPANHEKLLTIHSISDYKANKNPEYIKQLVEDTIRQGENPNKDFRLLCYNCSILMEEIKKSPKYSELTKLNQNELEQEIRMMYS
jgi:hypothetical protein